MEDTNETPGEAAEISEVSTEAAPEAPVAEASPNTAGIPMSAFSAAPGQYWGVDTSYHTVTMAQADDLYAAGVRVAFQCLWTGVDRPGPCESNIRNYAQAGIITCGYLSVSRHLSGHAHVVQGYDTLAQDVKALLLLVATDVELENLQFQGHVMQAVQALEDRGYPPLIYTSYNAWVNLLGNPKVPARWLLWNAYWDNDADTDFPRLPYGDFLPENVIGEQYTGGEWVNGVYADRNIFQARFFVKEEPAPPPEPAPVSLEDISLAFASYVHLSRNGQLEALAPQDRDVIRAVGFSL